MVVYSFVHKIVKVYNFKEMESLTHLFWTEGLVYIKHNIANSGITANRKYRSFFGISPEVCAKLWRLLTEKPTNSKPKHLLWSLLFLKCYNVEHVNASIVEVDEKTYRKWTWIFVNQLAELDVVGSLNNL